MWVRMPGSDPQPTLAYIRGYMRVQAFKNFSAAFNKFSLFVMKRNQENYGASYEMSKTIFIKNNFSIKQIGDLNAELVEWNNQMYHKHPTPYQGIAGFIKMQ